MGLPVGGMTTVTDLSDPFLLTGLLQNVEQCFINLLIIILHTRKNPVHAHSCVLCLIISEGNLLLLTAPNALCTSWVLLKHRAVSFLLSSSSVSASSAPMETEPPPAPAAGGPGGRPCLSLPPCASLQSLHQQKARPLISFPSSGW